MVDISEKVEMDIGICLVEGVAHISKGVIV